MTCIVGVYDKKEKRAYVGGDSAGVGGWDMTIRADQKVLRKAGMLFGFTSSFRMGQLIRYKLKIPEHPKGVSVESYMVTSFVDGLRDCFSDGGYILKKDNRESGGTFVVIYRGVVMAIADDFQVGTPRDGIAAVGRGDQVARGAILGIRRSGANVGTKESVKIALKAAEECSAGVRGPFSVISMEQT